MVNIAQGCKKIIHVDMDCFYAAIEMRDDPSLRNRPIAVGGSSERRGVICTCNYIAREYGVKSAMSTAQAYRCCPDLTVLPVNMPKYRQVASNIHAIFREFTSIVEPLALDEAYLDVTDSLHCQGSATWIAEKIRQKIFMTENLTASAGVASNKFLAKVASGWKKPNGLFVIHPQEIELFIKDLPIEHLWGVGKVTAEKLHRLGYRTCRDLQEISLYDLVKQFGKLGKNIYEQCRGIDHRLVTSNRVRKSLSVEETFAKDITALDDCKEIMTALYKKFIFRLQAMTPELPIKSYFIKLKFYDFKVVSAEKVCDQVNIENFLDLFQQTYVQHHKPLRLMGLGVRFSSLPLQQLSFLT